ncbi:MAG: ankyrin repeat domain-containing protein [Campylobacter sp.]|nr:ankyrin repeat domain-containing protein [Campylobacter sp.]
MKKLIAFLITSTLMFASQETCQMLANRAFFNTQPSEIDEQIFYCEGSILNFEKVKTLLEVAKVVRGENVNCVGYPQVAKNENSLKWLILQASFAPEIYAKGLAKPQIAEDLKDGWNGYFRYWAYQSFYNFAKFNEFWQAYNQAQNPLVKFYEDKGYDTQSAAYYATNVLNEFLKFAVGEFKNLSKKLDISREQKQLSDKNLSYDAILALLYSKQYSQAQLNEILKTLLLLNKGTNVISEILKMGAQIDIGDESALFFALGSKENVKFLLQNGADVNYKNAFGKSAIFYASELKDSELIKILLENGANANDKIIDENTKNVFSSLGRSLPFYVQLCALEHTNRSVFMNAAAYSNHEILEILLANGAVLDDVDDLGFNALDYAKKTKNEENIIFLQNLGLKSNIFE